MLRTALCLGIGLVTALGASASVAEELPRTQLKVVGLQSHLNSFKNGEQPFWEEHIPEASGGQITATITAQDLNGLKGPEILRLMSLGVIDFASGVIGYMSGDSPEFDGVDLAGVSPDMATTRRVVDAYSPVLERIMEEEYGAKLLMLFPSPPQVLWCRTPIESAADLEGMQVRVFTASMADLISGMGATTVSMPFGEVATSLERGVIDCAVTGTLSGNTNRLHEVTTHMLTLYSGWAIHFTAVSQRTWDQLDPAVQDFLLEEIGAFKERLWETVAEEEMDGINCSIGRDPCVYGFKGSMTLVEPTAEDLARAKTVVAGPVLRNWIERCGDKCAEDWFATVGEVVGISAVAE